MHEIRFCTQNIEITPHPAQTQHPITVPLNDDIHCIDGRCIPYPHRAEYVCELDALQAEHFFQRMCFPGQITGIHDALTDGYSSLVPRSSNHRCGELWNSLQIIIVFFSEKW